MAYQIEKLIQGGAGLTTSKEGKRILVMDVLPGELVELGGAFRRSQGTSVQLCKLFCKQVKRGLLLLSLLGGSVWRL